METSGYTNPADKLVLIVDDDDAVRDLIEFVIKKEGFKVDKAADGEEALQKARQISPDLILLDLMLPKFGGFEILRELQNDETVNIPIVIITGRYTDRSTSDMIKQEPNVKDFIEKPVKPQALAAVEHKILKTKPPIKRGERPAGETKTPYIFTLRGGFFLSAAYLTWCFGPRAHSWKAKAHGLGQNSVPEKDF